MILQLEGLAGANNPSPYKVRVLQNATQDLLLGGNKRLEKIAQRGAS
jgi:hypothetical protein